MIYLKDFIFLDEEEILLVYRWRMDEKIKQFMKTKLFSLKKHRDFILRLRRDKSKKYFLVFKNHEAIGVINFINITRNSCKFGLYTRPKSRGLGQILMDACKNYAFKELRIKKISSCVFKQNTRALNLYLKNNFHINKEDKKMFYIELMGGGD